MQNTLYDKSIGQCGQRDRINISLRRFRMRTGHFFQLIARSGLLALHLGHGLFLISFRFNTKDQQHKNAAIQKWSLRLAGILGIKIQHYGQAVPDYAQNYMLLSNHISWFDIFALNTLTVSRFIAKADIQSWPILNRLCTAAGTFFINRERIKDTKRVNDAITLCLKNGDRVAFFPEGTTTDGMSLRPFKTSLVQAAIEARSTIQPIYLNYCQSGRHSSLASYADETTLLQSLHSILSHRNLSIEIYYLEPISTSGRNRAEITERLHQAIHRAHHNFITQYADMAVMHPLEK
jgi:1-acyl-sn-glycerol-3-phosphate acyltransferase